jgi:Dna[CI] antecedent, DciA
VSQRLSSYLKASPELDLLSLKVGQLCILQKQYAQLVPAPLGLSSRVLQLNHNVLTLSANNAAIAAKLRQLAPELVELFKKNSYDIDDIRIKVRVLLPIAPRRHRSSSLGIAEREQLANFTTTLANSPLKVALERLATITDNSLPKK